MDLERWLDSLISGWTVLGLTTVKKSENGRPLSRANAHVSRDTEARVLLRQKNIIMASMVIRTFVHAFDLVAW